MKQSKFIEFIEALTEKGELDSWLECNDESEVREAIIELIKRSGEVMRGRTYSAMMNLQPWDHRGEIIRALPGVTLEDLQK